MGRLRYLLAATLALAAVGVGAESVLLGRAYRTLPPQPVPGNPALLPVPPPGPVVSTAPPGSPQAAVEAAVKEAVFAINRYAVAHEMSFAGATAARLRQADPRLPRSVFVIAAAPAGYCVEADVKGRSASATVPGYGVVPYGCILTIG